MGLRLAEGIDPAALAERLGVDRTRRRSGGRPPGRPRPARARRTRDPSHDLRRPDAAARLRSSPRSPPRRRVAAGETTHGRARRGHLPHFEQPLGDAVAAEAEIAVDPGEAVLVDQLARRERPPDRPVRARCAPPAAPRHSPGWRADKASCRSARDSGCTSWLNRASGAAAYQAPRSAGVLPSVRSLAHSSVPSAACGRPAAARAPPAPPSGRCRRSAPRRTRPWP